MEPPAPWEGGLGEGGSLIRRGESIEGNDGLYRRGESIEGGTC